MRKVLAVFLGMLLASAAAAQTPVVQSGNITAGHQATWQSQGVIQDGGGQAVNASIAGSSGTTITAGSTFWCSNSGCASSTANTSLSSITATITNFYFSVATAPAGVQTITAALYVGPYGALVATGLTCTITGVATSCSDLAHTAVLNPGQAWAIRVVASGSAASTGGEAFSMQQTASYPPPLPSQTVLQSGDVTAGHLAMWTTNGVISDGGTSSGGGGVIVPVTQGGTGLTGGTSGGILGFTSATTMASSALLGLNQLVLGGGAGATPFTLGTLGTTTTVLHGNAAGVPSFAAIDAAADITGILAVVHGGTGLSSGTSGGILGFTASGTIASSGALTANRLLLGGGAGVLPSVLGSLGTATTVLHGNAGGVPTFGAVALTTDISGTLPVANGGTGITSGTSGGILGYTAAGTIASSAALTVSQLVLGGGAGATPTSLGSLGTTTQVLHGNAAGNPSFAAVSLTADTTGTLTVARGGTSQTTFTANLPLIGNAGTNVTQGTRTGNTTAFVTGAGAFTNAHCAAFDANGNIVDFGGTCAAGGLIVSPPPAGRLTLTSGTPIMVANNVATSSLFYTPTVGNIVPIYDGVSVMVPTVFTELTNAVGDNTTNPIPVAASSVYDLFVWNNAGTVRLTRSLPWFSTTSRCAAPPCTGGTEPTDPLLVNGIYTNRNTILGSGAGCSSACPAANRGTYVGTVFSDSGAKFSVDFGAGAAGGHPGFLGVYNFYNQVQMSAFVYDTTANYTYAVNVTRAWNNSAGNRVTFVKGFNDNAVSVSAQQIVHEVGVAGLSSTSGWAIDSTVGFSQAAFCISQSTLTIYCTNPLVSGLRFAGLGGGATISTLGAHFITGTERADNGTFTYDGNNSSEQYLIVSVWQ